MWKKKILALALTLVLGVLMAGCGQNASDGDDNVAVAVSVTTATVGDISEDFNFSGEVTAGGDVQVIPKVAGRITRVNVKPGAEVKKGDLLVQLEAQELALAVRQAEATLEMAKANLNSVENGGGLAQMQANVRQLEINYNLTAEQLQTMEDLYAEGGLAQQQLNEVRARFEVAKSQYELAKDQLAAHQRGEGQLEILAAQVKQAEVGLELARLNYKNATITAPLDGTISLVNAEVGNLASPGMPVVTLMTGEAKQVVAMLTEQAVTQVKPGMRLNIEIPALDVVYPGVVTEVSPAVTTGTKFYLVKAELQEESGVLPGMFARLKLIRTRKTDTVLVPREAVLGQESTYYLFTVSEGKAKRRAVELGIRDESFAEILDGVRVGESVVVAGQHFLRDGASVVVEGGEL
jgi:multidrug efflux pump subunit AcrA (membrane-fusion protein)